MVKVFVPGHISGFWFIVENEDMLKTGSLGAGLILEPGLIIEDLESIDCKIVYNNKGIYMDTYRGGHEFANIPCTSIRVSSPFELGVGYGASAGVTIGGLYFSFIKKGFKVNWDDIGRYAHLAEVKYRTGYGDVITEIYGRGLEIRRKPGAPGIGFLNNISISRKIRVLTITLKKYSTQEMFRIYGDKIKKYGPIAYNEFIKDPSIEKFGEVSHWFSIKTGMMTKEYEENVYNVLKYGIKNGFVIDFFVKKSLLVVISDESGYIDVYNSLKKLGEPSIFTLNFSGCKILY